eukprot:GHVT01008005.1.p2 GENE.GHVT01008005.1~~GHVT01008005.1.p2  ORF type:complete len:127 (-),score=43.15 GHVT01008005.1:242-622(-)
MTKQDAVDNLGTIAKSGSLAFVQEQQLKEQKQAPEQGQRALETQKKDEASAIIGQFGVGFYSSFIVANRVDVFTRRFDATAEDLGDAKPPGGSSEGGWKWTSDGSGSFSIQWGNCRARDSRRPLAL